VGGNAHRLVNSLKGEDYENKNKKKTAIDGFINSHNAINAYRGDADDSVRGGRVRTHKYNLHSSHRR
jgi:hypothetical protein